MQLVLSGHDHLYEHDKVYLPEYDGKGIHVIISGGAGSPLRSGTKPSELADCCEVFDEDGIDVSMIRQIEIYHYCLIDITPNKITVRVM